MKLFELTWRILCGEYEFTQRQFFLFKNVNIANRYGDIEEFTNNTDKQPKRKPSEKQLESARDSACWKFGRSYRFNSAREIKSFTSNCGQYDVMLVKREQEAA